MYTGYFHFKQEPFRITPDPDFLYLSPSHKEALASIIYGVKQRKGFVAVIGEVGVGKTTILRSFLEKVDTETVKVIYIFNPNMSFGSLLQTIYHNLGQFVESEDTTEMLNQLYHILIREYQKGVNVVVVIDEAQNMPLKTLESLRMLSNLETATDKLIQVVFSGQPEFEEMLGRFELRQLRQRIAIKSTIRPLTRDESIDYIRHRLSKVSDGTAKVFADRTLALLVRMAAGIPRTINILCDNCLISTYGYQQHRVEPRVLREIGADLGFCKPPIFQWRLLGLLAALVASCGLWAGINRSWQVTQGAAPLPMKPAAAVAEAVQTSEPVSPASVPAASEPAVAAATDTPAEKSGQGRMVRKGDTLVNMVSEQYGTSNRELLRMVRRNNPGITDPNRIVEGQRIMFPAQD